MSRQKKNKVIHNMGAIFIKKEYHYIGGRNGKATVKQ